MSAPGSTCAAGAGGAASSPCWHTTRDGVRLRVSERGAAVGASDPAAAAPLAAADPTAAAPAAVADPAAAGGDPASPAAGAPPVVLVHGWKGSHRLWDRTVVALEARGIRTLAFDLRGMGESDKPPGTYGFDVFADDLGELLAARGLDGATVVGWSMGCTVVLRHMQRDGARVGRVVLLNGPLRLTRADDFPHAMSDAQFDGYLDEMTAGWPASERAFQAESVLPGSDPAVVDWLYGIALQTPLPVALSAVREQAKLDMRDAVRELRVPVMAAYATGDPYYPTTLGDWIADAAPDGRAVVFERSAHGTPFEEPEAFADAVARFGTP